MPRFMITRKFKRWAEPIFVSGVPWFKTKSQLHVSNIFHQLPHKHSSTPAATHQGISHSVPFQWTLLLCSFYFPHCKETGLVVIPWSWCCSWWLSHYDKLDSMILIAFHDHRLFFMMMIIIIIIATSFSTPPHVFAMYLGRFLSCLPGNNKVGIT